MNLAILVSNEWAQITDRGNIGRLCNRHFKVNSVTIAAHEGYKVTMRLYTNDNLRWVTMSLNGCLFARKLPTCGWKTAYNSLVTELRTVGSVVRAGV